MKIEFTISGDLERILRKALRKTGDLSPIFKDLGAELQRSTAKTFQSEGERGSSPFGFESGRWKDLAESTKKWRKRIGKSSSKILNLRGSGGLKGSITYEARKTSVKWGPSTKAPYGKYHQAPELFNCPWLPKRPFIGFYAEDHAALVKYTKEFIMRLFK